MNFKYIENKIIEQALEILGNRIGSYRTAYPYWIEPEDENHETYCYKCCEKEFKKREKITKNKDEINMYHSYSLERDTVLLCDKCGRLLSYSLSSKDYELDHFESIEICLKSICICKEMERVLSDYQFLPKFQLSEVPEIQRIENLAKKIIEKRL